MSVPAIVVISYFFSGLLVAGFKMQMMGFPSSVTFLIKGLVLVFVLAGELLTFYRISWNGRDKKSGDKIPPEHPPDTSIPDTIDKPVSGGDL